MVPVTFGRRAVKCRGSVPSRNLTRSVPYAGKCSRSLCLFGSLVFSYPRIYGTLGFGQQCGGISAGAKLLIPERRIPGMLGGFTALNPLYRQSASEEAQLTACGISSEHFPMVKRQDRN